MSNEKSKPEEIPLDKGFGPSKGSQSGTGLPNVYQPNRFGYGVNVYVPQEGEINIDDPPGGSALPSTSPGKEEGGKDKE